ncbi:MAG: SpoVG family protein [Lachnospiraceae bacterium]|nr:SpoVG family protein [Lachnospiraceae bacterium]
MSHANADPDSAVKAHVSMTIDQAFVIKNLMLVQGKNGLFVNMPHHKTGEVGEDGKPVYKDDAFPLSKELLDKIQKAAIEYFENEGKSVSFEFGKAASLEEKSGSEKSEKEGARHGKFSLLKALKNEEKIIDTDRPLKITMDSPKPVGDAR